MLPPNFRCTGQKRSLPRLMPWRLRSSALIDIRPLTASSMNLGWAANSWVIFRWKSCQSAGTPTMPVMLPPSSTSPMRSEVSSSR